MTRNRRLALLGAAVVIAIAAAVVIGTSGSSTPESSGPATVVVRDLRKTYRVPEREGGLRAATTSLIRRRSREWPTMSPTIMA